MREAEWSHLPVRRVTAHRQTPAHNAAMSGRCGRSRLAALLDAELVSLWVDHDGQIPVVAYNGRVAASPETHSEPACARPELGTWVRAISGRSARLIRGTSAVT